MKSDLVAEILALPVTERVRLVEANLANANRLALVERVCRECGYEPPRIVTPIELMEV